MTSLPLSEDEFIHQLEEANRERFKDEDWSFNERQRNAILAGNGPLWITAGPGSGKTEVLISRTLKLILADGVQPGSILLTTFTEKAAQNLEERIVDRLEKLGFEDEVDANDIRIGTLHSLCNDITQEYRYPDYANVELLDEDAQQLFMYNNCDFVSVLRGNVDTDEWDTVTGGELTGDAWRFFDEVLPRGVSSQYGPNKWQATGTAAKLFNRISQYRASTDSLRRSPQPEWRVCAEGLERYRETLRENHRCDFARLLEQFVDFIDSESGQRFIDGEPDRERPPLEHVLVDEYQDTNPLQEELYFRLVEKLDSPNITVVGDDDQALYRFRGGTVECLIRFPDRAKDHFETSVTKEQLRTNYRSTEDIVSWCNRYIGDYPLMQREGARASNKEPMIVARDETEGRESVRSLLVGNSDKQSAETAAELVERIHDEGYIEDYSQVAFLFKSTKESSRWAGRYVEALRERNIPVHNPRNKAFLKQDEIEFALSAVIRCVDPDLEGTDAANVRGRVRNQINRWSDKFEDYIDEYAANDLDNYVRRKRRELERADGKESLGYTLLELLYRILSFNPFQQWIEDPDHPERGKRLGQLTKLFDSFASVTGPEHMQKSSRTLSVSTRFLGSFYYVFCGYLEASSFDEPEDPHDQIPTGFVQMMTVHQAKGLEFPVVFASDLDSEPWMSGTYWLENQLTPYAEIEPSGTSEDRAERDEVRRFYVAYSRAEEDLLLLDNENATTNISLGYHESGQPLSENWFKGSRELNAAEDFLNRVGGSVGPHREVGLKRRYSITGDVLAYRRCKRQYGYYNELDFAPNHVTQLFFGRVVHETLDRAHRHYAGDIDGATEGEVPTDDDIEKYFTEVSEALKARNIYPMSKEAEETALDYIQRFNRKEGARLYPRVIDTEHRLQSNRDDFVLEGVVDVLAGDDIDGYEIWDYKAGQRPDGGRELDDYQAQLNTYAELYRYQQGEYPDRGVIYFLGEESRDDAVFQLEFEQGSVESSLSAFEQTVTSIEDDREQRNWFNITPGDAPSNQTCAECDIRWNCPARPEYHGNQ
ncbi:ATP-dependent DNA helicase [Halorussus halophilus]|uniref:ATP-dependent DNA helicase n=1 Tax=Halorussus halophilus TaxID=2650975 RepID=UPI00130143B8|nr:ATP-dependent DNA helicase [Halorussus halophilus]